MGNGIMQLLQSVGVNLPGMEDPEAEARRLAELEAAQGIPPPAVGQEIVVSGANPNAQDQYLAPDAGPMPPAAPLPGIGNREDIQRGIDASKDVPQREGRFGVKGTLRDILGTVSDAFLVQSGNKAVYAPQVEREKEANAMAGMTRNVGNAVERLASAGFGDSAGSLYKEMGAQDNRDAVLKSQDQGRQSLIEGRNYDRFENARDYSARALAAAGNDPVKVTEALRLAGIAAERAGTSLEELGITDEMTDAQRSVYAGTDMTVKQQFDVPVNQQRADATSSQARSSAQRAAREPAPRATPNPTNATIAAPLLAKVSRGEALTKGERDTLDRVAPQPARNRRSRGDNQTQTPASPTSPSQFKITGSRPKN
jgi:hypothetical protein